MEFAVQVNEYQKNAKQQKNIWILRENYENAMEHEDNGCTNYCWCL